MMLSLHDGGFSRRWRSWPAGQRARQRDVVPATIHNERCCLARLGRTVGCRNGGAAACRSGNGKPACLPMVAGLSGQGVAERQLLPTWPVVTADLFNCDFMPQHVE
jgi:hypothetical protein